jgi:hypothetical protein
VDDSVTMDLDEDILPFIKILEFVRGPRNSIASENAHQPLGFLVSRHEEARNWHTRRVAYWHVSTKPSNSSRTLQGRKGSVIPSCIVRYVQFAHPPFETTTRSRQAIPKAVLAMTLVTSEIWLIWVYEGYDICLIWQSPCQRSVEDVEFHHPPLGTILQQHVPLRTNRIESGKSSIRFNSK